MVESNRDRGAGGAIAGRLEGVSLPDLLWALRGRRETGVLTLERRGVEKSLYFDEGGIVFATSSDPDDRLGEMLLRQGVISLDQLEEALSNLHRGRRLGTLLVEAGSMGAGELVSGVLAQVRSIVLDLFCWEEGNYRFTPGELPTEEVITLDMKTNELLRSGIRQIRSFSRIRRSVGPPRTVYELTRGWREVVVGLSLSEAEEQLIRRLEESPESVEQLCRDVLLSNFEIYQTLWMLKVQGVIQEHDTHGRWAGEAAFQGSLEDEGFADIMVRLSREGETGVLYVRRRSEERSFHFRDGRCVFATSSDPDDGLVSYLLMRGVISLKDREETDKRLLSNKRVGTILREMGVIDESDLREMVRQQLSEIVFDTFRFADGDYSFVPGDLPSTEEITLDLPAESLVLAGLRRVTSWSRVRRGCGGADATLELAPSYMNVLDLMGAGTEEWQVVTALKSPKAPKDVCRIVRLDDFRVCQVLWALRVLGAVQPAEAPEAVVAADETRETAVTAAAPPTGALQSDLGRDLPETDGPAPEYEHAPDDGLHAEGDEAEREAEQEENIDATSAAPAEGPWEDTEPAEEEASEQAPDAPEPVAAETPVEIEVRHVDAVSVAPDEADEPVPIEVAHDAATDVADEPDEGSTEPQQDTGGSIPSPGIDERFARAASGSVDAAEPEPIECDAPEDALGHAFDATFTDADDPVDDGMPAPHEQTQIISRDVVEAALRGPAPEDDPGDPDGSDGAEDRAAATVADEPSDRDEDEPRSDEDEGEEEWAASNLDATQVIPREALASALEGDVERDEPESGPQEPIWDLEQSTRTVRLARDEVDGAMTGGDETEPSDSIDRRPTGDWEPPDDLESIIAQFNAMQRVVYRTIRAEVGAGAANFIRSCCGQGPQAVDPLAGAELRSDGSWDTEGLRRAVHDNRIQDPRLEYQRLIDREIELLRTHIGDARVGELERQIQKVERATADPY